MTNNNKDIIVVGSANTDMVIMANHFPQPGETILGHGFMTNHGGKGANQAVAAARLGGNVKFIARVGDDSFGASTLEMLQQEGIDVSHVSITPETPSGVALITTIDSGENTIIVDSGANAKLSAEDIEKAEDCFQSGGLLLMQLETPVPTLVKAAAIARERGCYVVLNPAPAPATPLPKELLCNVDLLIPNETEAALLSGVNVNDDDSASEALNKLETLGVKHTVVTLGHRGAGMLENGKLKIIPSQKVKAIDTTAAGDTFCGALCVRLLEGDNLEEAIAFANKAAAISVTRRGAQQSIPRLKEIE